MNRLFVMPITDHHVLVDQVDGAVGVVHAGFPHADARGFTVDKAVASNPQLPIALPQMGSELVQFLGTQFSLSMLSTTLATVVPAVTSLVRLEERRVGKKGVFRRR